MPKITIDDKEYEISEEIKELAVKLLGEKEAWPKKGDKTYAVDCDGDILDILWCEDNSGLLEMNNVFRTKKEAEREKMRRKSMKKTWLPKEGEDYWSSDEYENPDYSIWNGDFIDWYRYHTGQVSKTEEECQKKIDTYAEYWRGE